MKVHSYYSFINISELYSLEDRGAPTTGYREGFRKFLGRKKR